MKTKSVLLLKQVSSGSQRITRSVEEEVMQKYRDTNTVYQVPFTVNDDHGNGKEIGLKDI